MCNRFANDIAHAAVVSVDTESFRAAERAVYVEEDRFDGGAEIGVGEYAEELTGAREGGASVKEAVVVDDIALAGFQGNRTSVLVDEPPENG